MKAFSDIPKDPWYRSWRHSLQFIQNAPGFLQQQHQAHGPIFRCRLFGREYVRAHGPDVAQLVFRNSDELMSTQEGWSPVFDGIFPGGLLMKDGAQHLHHRRIMQHAFNRDAMRSYFSEMERWSEKFVDQLPANEPIDFFPYIKDQTLDLALKLFLGLSSKNELGRGVTKAFNDCVLGTLALVRNPWFSVKFKRAVEGRQTLMAVFFNLVKDRRQQPRNDLVSYLCEAEDEYGNKFNDEQVVDHLIFTMMAAHDTTASSISSLLYLVSYQPQWQAVLNQEARQFTDLNYDDLVNLQQTENIYKETLRMFPPVVTMPRVFNREVDLMGYEIPKSTRTGINVYGIHHDEQFWQAPEEFDPNRFARGEDKGHSFQYLPFGGGAHKCIGMHLGMMEAKILLRALFSRFTVTRHNLDKVMEFTAVPIWRPKGPLELVFEPVTSVTNEIHRSTAKTPVDAV